MVIVIMIGFLHIDLSISHSSETEIRLKNARKEAISGNHAGAIRIYDSVLSANPKNLEALNGKARVLSWMGEYEKARDICHNILSINPTNMDAVFTLSDMDAWEKDYSKGISRLKILLNQFPEHKEILIRISRYSLWANEKKAAITYADLVLKKDPFDEEAKDIRKKALLIHSFESYLGYSYLDINDNVDGQNTYIGIRFKPSPGLSLFTQADYLNRFDKEEGRLTVGGSYPLSKAWGISGEVSFSPDADIYPVFSGRGEVIYSGIPSLVLYSGLNGSRYQEDDLFGASAAAEYYFWGSWALFSRLGISHTDFGDGDDSTDGSFFVKLTWYASDADTLFGYFAYGNEPYMNRTIDQIGKIEAKTYGIGGRYFFYPNIGISPRIEYQNRQRDTRYMEFALEFLYRW